MSEDGLDNCFPSEQGSWKGFKRYDFEYAGKPALIVQPKRELPDRPWVWRARFFGAFATVDLAMLEAGFHLVFVDTADMFGAPSAMEIWDGFYDQLTGEYGFMKKCILEGFSRGGLFIYNWAARHPERVIAIYADAPVCDIRSWPAGRFNGPGAVREWELCKSVYGLTEDDADAFDGSPIDILGPIAKARIPIIHVCGGADEVVPISENTHLLHSRLKGLGHDLTLIIKPDCLHHPHSLEDPAPVVDFLINAFNLNHNEEKQ